MIRSSTRQCPLPAIAVVAALSFSTAGHADPWNGFYAGAFAGGVWADADIGTDVGALIPGVSYFVSNPNIQSVTQNASGNVSSRSFTGGAQIGVNQRFGQVVAGVEIDFGRLNINSNRGGENVRYPTASANYSVSVAVETDWLLTTRGRLGWLVSPQFLVYATGGLAASDVETSNSFADTASGALGTGGASTSDTKVGYTIGGGLELAVDGAWSIKGEYLYLDLGSTSVHGTVRCSINCPNISPFNSSADLTASIARIGFNYSFTD